MIFKLYISGTLTKIDSSVMQVQSETQHQTCVIPTIMGLPTKTCIHINFDSSLGTKWGIIIVPIDIRRAIMTTKDMLQII